MTLLVERITQLCSLHTTWYQYLSDFTVEMLKHNVSRTTLTGNTIHNHAQMTLFDGLERVYTQPPPPRGFCKVLKHKSGKDFLLMGENEDGRQIYGTYAKDGDLHPYRYYVLKPGFTKEGVFGIEKQAVGAVPKSEEKKPQQTV